MRLLCLYVWVCGMGEVAKEEGGNNANSKADSILCACGPLSRGGIVIVPFSSCWTTAVSPRYQLGPEYCIEVQTLRRHSVNPSLRNFRCWWRGPCRMLDMTANRCSCSRVCISCELLTWHDLKCIAAVVCCHRFTLGCKCLVARSSIICLCRPGALLDVSK